VTQHTKDNNYCNLGDLNGDKALRLINLTVEKQID
jgi:hypothetical protein